MVAAAARWSAWALSGFLAVLLLTNPISVQAQLALSLGVIAQQHVVHQDRSRHVTWRCDQLPGGQASNFLLDARAQLLEGCVALIEQES